MNRLEEIKQSYRNFYKLTHKNTEETPEFYKAMMERVTEILDEETCGDIGQDGKPTSCCCCYFSQWYPNYKRCSLLKKQLPVFFRVNARLRDCPIRICIPTTNSGDE